jgi:hypothetical protein
MSQYVKAGGTYGDNIYYIPVNTTLFPAGDVIV